MATLTKTFFVVILCSIISVNAFAQQKESEKPDESESFPIEYGDLVKMIRKHISHPKQQLNCDGQQGIKFTYKIGKIAKVEIVGLECEQGSSFIKWKSTQEKKLVSAFARLEPVKVKGNPFNGKFTMTYQTAIK
jgi:hypothetical protein